MVSFDNGSRWVYEIKSLAFCPSNYGSRWKNKAKAWGAGAGASPADAKAATTASDRAAKASGIDAAFAASICGGQRCHWLSQRC